MELSSCTELVLVERPAPAPRGRFERVWSGVMVPVIQSGSEAVGRVAARSLVWGARRRRWTVFVFVLVVFCLLGDAIEMAAEVFAGLWLVPGVVAATVVRRWPVGWDRWVADPARRVWWSVWLAFRWSLATEVAGLGRWREVKRRQGQGQKPIIVRKWRPARAWPVITRSGIVLRVRVPRGLSADDVPKRVPALAGAMRAHSCATEFLSASHCRVRLVMRDALASPIAHVPASNGVIHLGVDADGAPVTMDPLKTLRLALQGMAGSGKSTLTYGLLMGLAARSDVLVAGVDPSSILLGPWRDGRAGEWIACGTGDLARAVAVLESMCAELDERTTYLASCGFDQIAEFSAECPLIVIVMEEYPGFMAALKAGGDSELLGRAQAAIGRLIREGRKVGMLPWFLAQRMSSKAIDTDDRANLDIRISLRVDSSEAAQMLHGGSSLPSEAQMRSWPAGMGLIERPGYPATLFRAGYVSYSAYRKTLAEGIAQDVAGWRAPVVEIKTADDEPADEPTPIKGERTRRRQPKQPRKRRDEAA